MKKFTRNGERRLAWVPHATHSQTEQRWRESFVKNETNLRVAKEVNGIQGSGMCFCLSEFQNMEITSLICELNYKCERVDHIFVQIFDFFILISTERVLSSRTVKRGGSQGRSLESQPCECSCYFSGRGGRRRAIDPYDMRIKHVTTGFLIGL